ncbi:MAG: nicotinate-nucleotide diphosphorylase (carboxylating) [Planctomycetes bacterium TMED75]|nr:nicotinate-nucleotide diphosphorylase (carboxylating) [Planctomycetaceae bacterium]OUU90472.1 MAG: nicotinate-nucleotide diphosphorylase (carboxylating) [Planctomycetes bacterium TMED75]
MTLCDLNELELPQLFATLVEGPQLDQLLDLAMLEDLGEQGDLTTRATVDPTRGVDAAIVARSSGILSGVGALDHFMRRHAGQLSWWWNLHDGDRVQSGEVVCRISGALAMLLPVERIMLNLLGRLSGVATSTAAHVAAVAGTNVRICDTRKTTPGHRALEKYAVRCGGGWLHRIGLFDAMLVKDNHIGVLDPDEMASRVVSAAREVRASSEVRFIEVEVDNLDQLAALIEVGSDVIDIVLLDNMPPDLLRQAVVQRDGNAPHLLLEASGGVTLEALPSIADSGIDRISVGALTHSVNQLDFGLDLL